MEDVDRGDACFTKRETSREKKSKTIVGVYASIHVELGQISPRAYLLQAPAFTTFLVLIAGVLQQPSEYIMPVASSGVRCLFTSETQ